MKAKALDESVVVAYVCLNEQEAEHAGLLVEFAKVRARVRSGDRSASKPFEKLVDKIHVVFPDPLRRAEILNKLHDMCA